MEMKRHRAGVLVSALALITSGSACSADLTPPTTMIPSATAPVASTPEPTLVAVTATQKYQELSVKGGSYGAGRREIFRVNDPAQIQAALDVAGRWMATVNAAQQMGSTVTAEELAAQLEPLMDSTPDPILDEVATLSERFAPDREYVCADRAAFAEKIVAQRELNQNTLLPQEKQALEITGPFRLQEGIDETWEVVKASDETWYSTYIRLPAPARYSYTSPLVQRNRDGMVTFSSGLRFREGEWRVAWADRSCGELDPLDGFYLQVKGNSVEATSTPAIPVNTPASPNEGYTPINQADADAVIANAQAVLDLLAFKEGPPTNLDSLETQLRGHMLPKTRAGLCGLPELMAALQRNQATGTYIRMTQDEPYYWEPVEFRPEMLVPQFADEIGQWRLAVLDETVQWEGRLDRVDVATGEVVQSGSTSIVTFTFGVILTDKGWSVSSVTYCDLSRFFILE